jgi:hypothetical protein
MPSLKRIARIVGETKALAVEVAGLILLLIGLYKIIMGELNL